MFVLVSTLLVLGYAAFAAVMIYVARSYEFGAALNDWRLTCPVLLQPLAVVIGVLGTYPH